MRRTIAAAVLGLATALLVASPSAAYAASYLDEAVQALQSSNVYISPEVRTIDAGTRERLEQQTHDTGIGVVVLPAGASTEAGDIPQFVVNITRDSGKETVIVAVGSDLEAASRTMQKDAAGKLANDLERSNSSTGDALVKFVTEARSATSAESPQTSAPADFSGIGLPIALLVTVGVVAAGAVWRFRKKILRPTQPVVKAPEPIKELLAKIRMQISDVNDEGMQQQLNLAITDTEELFKRLTRKKSGEIHQRTAKYVGLLGTVHDMVEKYVDVQNHERYYQPQYEALLRDGKNAAEQYANGVVKNIREVELGSLTDFKVDIKMLNSVNPTDDPQITQ